MLKNSRDGRISYEPSGPHILLFDALLAVYSDRCNCRLLSWVWQHQWRFIHTTLLDAVSTASDSVSRHSLDLLCIINDTHNTPAYITVPLGLPLCVKSNLRKLIAATLRTLKSLTARGLLYNSYSQLCGIKVHVAAWMTYELWLFVLDLYLVRNRTRTPTAQPKYTNMFC